MSAPGTYTTIVMVSDRMPIEIGARLPVPPVPRSA